MANNPKVTTFPTEKTELAQKNNDAPPGEQPNGKFEEKQFGIKDHGR
jgi:hypothetical protein